MFVISLLGLFAVSQASPIKDDETPQWYPNCGQSKYPDAGVETLIVGGKDARPNEFPFIASMRRAPRSGEGAARHFCGGFVINTEWVMTAAHCMEDEEVSRMRVVLGEHQTNVSSSIRQEFSITAYFNHELYGAPGNIRYDYDIAMVKLSSPVTFNENIQPLCKPEDGNDYVGQIGSVMGWGTMRSGTRWYPTILQWTNIPVITNEDCDSVLGPNRITGNMMCAGRIPELERDTCQGDSGGPLAVKINDRFVAVGITSWGRGCASGTPGAYARITPFLGWVQSKIDKN